MFGSDLSEDERLWAAAVQAEHKADGLEELLNAAAELFLLQATGGARVQDAGLHDKLEEVLQSLEEMKSFSIAFLEKT